MAQHRQPLLQAVAEVPIGAGRIALYASPMDDVVVGTGDLAGKGVYASRDFDQGEVVVSYRLLPLTSAEYDALPESERLFVHSYGGRRYLYPSPACFVNHSDDPSCYQDFEDGCDIALRPISKGEAITIDATQETDRELSTFVDVFADSLVRRSAADLEHLVDSAAVAWMPDGTHRGRDAVVAGLIGSRLGTVSDIDWLIGTGRWEAVGSADLRVARGVVHHMTMMLKVVRGNWQIVYQHVG